MNKVYYLVKEVDDSVDYAKNLPISLKTHAKTKDSACAWNLLIDSVLKAYSLSFTPTFLKSGKPMLGGINISLSHSNGVVAICFSQGVSVGIDIEMERKEIPPKTLEFLDTNKDEFFSVFTKREAVIKAKDYSALKKGVEKEFVGITKTLKIKNKNFYLSVFGEDAEFIEI